MAYTGITNQTPATGAVAMYQLKTALVAAGWIVMSSSDGTTYNASGDQITSGLTGAGGFGNTRAWVRLRMPLVYGATRELTIQRGTANNTDWRMKISPLNGFVGGSPSATVTPTATDEGVLLGGGTDASPTFQTILPTDASYRYNAMCGDLSDHYTFWAGAFPIGGGDPRSMIFLDKMVDGTYPVADVEPYIWHVSQGTSTTFSQNFGQSGYRSISSTGWWKKGLTGETYTTFWGAVWSEGSTGTGGAPLSINQTPVFSLPSNPHNNKDDLIPIMWARPFNASSPGYKGFNHMVRFQGVSRVTGDTLSLVSTRDRIIYRPCALPWDGSIVLI